VQATLFIRGEVMRRAEPRIAVKIGQTGTSCVGKSSVLNNLYDRLGVQCVGATEAARHFFENDYSSDMGGRFSFPVQARIQRRAMMHEIKASLYATQTVQGLRNIARVAIVGDRTVFDAAVCLVAVGDEKGAALLLEEAKTWAHLDPYDRLYLLDPSGVPYVNDETRTETPEERQLFHDTFVGLFDEHDIAYTLVSGTEQERTDTVLSGIQEAWAAKAASIAG
jgi:predicted ATPase